MVEKSQVNIIPLPGRSKDIFLGVASSSFSSLSWLGGRVGALAET